MRPWIRWLLVASALASALAVWWPDTVNQAVLHRETASPNPQMATNSGLGLATLAPNVQVRNALPSHLPVVTLDSAKFDPFIGVQPPPPTPPEPQPVPAVVGAPPITPKAPPLAYRYLGQLVDPLGMRSVYLGKGDKDVLVAVGTQLEEGYVVDAIAADGIQLRYPPLDVRVVIHIPPPKDNPVP